MHALRKDPFPVVYYAFGRLDPKHRTGRGARGSRRGSAISARIWLSSNFSESYLSNGRRSRARFRDTRSATIWGSSICPALQSVLALTSSSRANVSRARSSKSDLRGIEPRAMDSNVYHSNTRWYTFAMPTARRRYQITETDDVARALQAAARLWPDEPRSRLVVRAIIAGGDALASADVAATRRAALARVAGKYSDDYGVGYLDELRKDWPDMIVVDASVVIALLDQDDAHHANARSLAETHVSDGFLIHPITLAEVLVGAVRNGRGTPALCRARHRGISRWPTPTRASRSFSPSFGSALACACQTAAY